MQKLYQKCFDENLINKATNYILVNYIQYMLNENDIKNIDKNIVKKEVKLRLRRYKKVYGESVIKQELLLCELNEYYKYNIYNLITQQVVYQVLQQYVIEDNKYTFGYKREGIQEKDIVIKTANILQTSKACFIIQFDLSEIFNKISLNDIIAEFKKFGIKDIYFLKTLKHILWYSKNYNGIGINKHNILYPLIVTIYLNSFDKYIEQLITRDNNSYQRNFNKHKEHYIEWLQKTKNKPYVQFYRHNEQGILICHSKSEQLYMQDKLLHSPINQSNNIKIYTYYNRAFLNGFYIKKRKLEKNYLEIKIANIKLIKKYIRTFKFNSFLEIWKIKKWILMIMSYYDIVNDISELTNALINRMYYRSKHNKHLKKVSNKSEYIFNNNDTIIALDIFDIRKYTKISYKEYIFNKFWIKSKDYLTPWNTIKFINYNIYIQALFVKQRGKDILTNKPLDFNNIYIYHLTTNQNKNLNVLKNLILISSETYKEIHKYDDKINRLIHE